MARFAAPARDAALDEPGAPNQHRRSNAAELEDLWSQVRQLQQTVDGLRGDLDRVQEGQDFTTRLLSERSSKRD